MKVDELEQLKKKKTWENKEGIFYALTLDYLKTNLNAPFLLFAL